VTAAVENSTLRGSGSFSSSAGEKSGPENTREKPKPGENRIAAWDEGKTPQGQPGKEVAPGKIQAPTPQGGEAMPGALGEEDIVSMAASKIETLARAVEPHLTADIMGAATTAGGHPTGLEFKVKSEESLKNKIQGYQKLHPDWGPPQLKAHLYDANRYTVLFTPDNTISGMTKVMDEMKGKGYQVIRTRNFWTYGDGTYKGINSVLRDQGGNYVELQFHTDQSIEVKEKQCHPLYKERDETDDPERYKALTAQMIAIWKEVPVPAGIEAIQPFESEEGRVLSSESRPAAGASS